MFIQIDACETPLFSEDHPRSWIFNKEKAGGGVLMDFGCHRIEVMLNLMGRITEVKGITGQVYPNHEVEDVATVLLKFENNACGVLTVMRGGTINRDTVYIQGTDGSIQVDNLNEGNIRYKTGSGSYQDTLPKAENGHLPLIESFTQAVLNNKAPKIDGNVGLDVQRVIETAYKH
jgi:predicted dehydrogenase